MKSDETPGMAAGRSSLKESPQPVSPLPATSPVRYKYIDPSIRPELLRFWESLDSGFELVLLERVILPWQTADLEQPVPVLAIARFGQKLVGIDRWLPLRESIHAAVHEYGHIRGEDERTTETRARRFCAASTLAPGRCQICRSDFTAWLRQYEEHGAVLQ